MITLEQNAELVGRILTDVAAGKQKAAAEQVLRIAPIADRALLQVLVYALVDSILVPRTRGRGRPHAGELGGFERLAKEMSLGESVEKERKTKTSVAAASRAAGKKAHTSESTAKGAYYKHRKKPAK